MAPKPQIDKNSTPEKLTLGILHPYCIWA